MVVHWITSLLGHTRQRQVPTRPAAGVAQTRRMPPRRGADIPLIVGYHGPVVKSRRAGASPPHPTQARGITGNPADQRPGIMMCAEDVPTSMTQEPARV